MGIAHIHSLLSQTKGFVNESYVRGESRSGNQKFIASKLTHIRTYYYGFSLLLTQKQGLSVDFVYFRATRLLTQRPPRRLHYEGISLLQLLSLLLYPGAMTDLSGTRANTSSFACAVRSANFELESLHIIIVVSGRYLSMGQLSW